MAALTGNTPTPRLRVMQQAKGTNINAWGEPNLNDAIQRLEEGIAGVATIALTGATYTLLTQPYIADEARMAVLIFTSTYAGPTTITAPAVQKTYTVDNRTVYPLTFTTGASGTPGTAVARAGVRTDIICDGTNFVAIDLTLDQVAKPVAAVDMNSQRFANLGAPSAMGDAATKGYTDNAISAATATAISSLSNVGVPTTAYAFGNQKLTGLGNGTNVGDAVNLGQLQAQVFNIGATPAASAVGQVPRWNGSGYQPGAIDLASTNAVIGVLAPANGGYDSTAVANAAAAAAAPKADSTRVAVLEAGYALIGTVTPSGTSVDFTNLSADDILVTGTVGPSGSSADLSIAYSTNNGSSYSTSLAIGGTTPSGSARIFALALCGIRQGIAVGFGKSGVNNSTAPTNSTTLYVNMIQLNAGAQINAVRISFGGVSFLSGGSISFWGKR